MPCTMHVNWEDADTSDEGPWTINSTRTYVREFIDIYGNPTDAVTISATGEELDFVIEKLVSMGKKELVASAPYWEGEEAKFVIQAIILPKTAANLVTEHNKNPGFMPVVWEPDVRDMVGRWRARSGDRPPGLELENRAVKHRLETERYAAKAKIQRDAYESLGVTKKTKEQQALIEQREAARKQREDDRLARQKELIELRERLRQERREAALAEKLEASQRRNQTPTTGLNPGNNTQNANVISLTREELAAMIAATVAQALKRDDTNPLEGVKMDEE